MSQTSARHALPFIEAGQAQKEVAHNEAIALIDMLAAPAVEAVGVNAPPGSPAAGQCWVIGTAPTGAWAGRAGNLVCWTGSGWRFAAPTEGMDAWVGDSAMAARYASGAWIVGEPNIALLRVEGVPVVGARRPAIAAPSGGATIDGEARTALSAALSALRAHGLIAS